MSNFRLGYTDKFTVAERALTQDNYNIRFEDTPWPTEIHNYRKYA